MLHERRVVKELLQHQQRQRAEQHALGQAQQAARQPVRPGDEEKERIFCSRRASTATTRITARKIST